jgi:hypothetical protein
MFINKKYQKKHIFVRQTPVPKRGVVSNTNTPAGSFSAAVKRVKTQVTQERHYPPG